MVKLAWPSLLVHSSLGSDRTKGVTSLETVRTVLARGRLKEAMEGLEERGGEGRIPRSRGSEVTLYGSLTSATEGDWRGD